MAVSDTTLLREGGYGNITPPNSLRFAVAMLWAFVGDVFDALATFIVVIVLLATGFGAVAAKVIVEGISIIFFDIPVVLLAGTKSQRDNALTAEKIDKALKQLQTQVNSYRRTYASFLKYARQNRLLRRPVSKFALKFATVRKRIMRKPLGRLLRRMTLAKIPFIKLIPWRMIGVYGAHKQAKETYAIAQEAKEEYMADLQHFRRMEALIIQAIQDEENNEILRLREAEQGQLPLAA